MSAYQITLQYAEKLIQNFVTHTKLSAIATSEAFGGTISPSGFKGQTFIKDASLLSYKGIVSWFCYNTTDTSLPKIFLAFENSDSFDRRRPFGGPNNTVLCCPSPSSTFNFSGSTSAIDHIMNFRQAASNDVAELDRRIVQYATNFRSRNEFSHFLRHNYGFFENERLSDVEEFLRQAGGVKAVRYYFGYSNEDTYTLNNRNNIRIILFGIDSAGQAIIPQNKSEIVTNDAIILEKSWP